MEKWLPIPEYEDLYEASDAGKVRRIGRKELKARPTGAGYRAVCLYGPNGTKQISVHRCVWLAHVGPIQKGLWINHISGDKTDNRIANLELTTPAENQKHSYDVLKRKKSPLVGSVHHKTHLTEADVIAMRAAYDLERTTVNRLRLAAVYGIAHDTVKRIVYRTSWRHI